MPPDDLGLDLGARVQHHRDHDHCAEEAAITALEHPAPANREAAEPAVGILKRRYDHVLRRFDGARAHPLVHATHRHDSASCPEDWPGAMLHELACARLADRAEPLAPRTAGAPPTDPAT